jgi:hypothetical protein
LINQLAARAGELGALPQVIDQSTCSKSWRTWISLQLFLKLIDQHAALPQVD